MTTASALTLNFRAISDDDDSSALMPQLFREFWPSYQRWLKRSEPIDAKTCVDKLEKHMPELAPTFERLLERFGGGDDVARFLTLYNPPRLVRACTQLVVDGPDGAALIHSYDHHPDLFDGVVLSSRWSGPSTIAVTDCLWGVLDGVNEHGCAIALAFGGRQATGDGFAAPLIARYVLETCQTTAEARAALDRIPVHMPYTFVVVDAAGEFFTAFLGPDRKARFVQRRASTNHQGAVEWPAYISHVASEERLQCAEQMLGDASLLESADEEFLKPPIWRTDYASGSGTLYVARLSTRDHSLSLRWPSTRRRYCVGERLDDSFSVDLPLAANPA